MGIKKLLLFFFTWWNGNTVGTKLYTYFNGKKVGEDYFGNHFYESRNKKNRWCIYQYESDASKISPEWNSWLRFITNSCPTDIANTYEWQKPFIGNLTGLDGAYKPEIVRARDRNEDLNIHQSDYIAWKPE